ncbi:MAG TPA: glycosyltransferase family 4 protein [Nocardioidaceae bacterium]|nr:glycosyltransferase family 4 protein [Nocardioidaceae bacterium]
MTTELDRARSSEVGRGGRSRVLIIIQNLAVPFDRRVWLESQSLRDAGFDVTVVCPAGQDSVPHRVLDDIEIYTYRPYAPGGSAAGFLAEYAYSFAATARLVLRARQSRGPFDVMQACNPPDIFWPLARMLRRRDGTRFVFDHHDLCPELYRSRFHDARTPAYLGLELLERMTFRTADRVTSTNESYAAIARRRGGKPAEHVTVVRTGPDPERMARGPEATEMRRGRRHLVAYLGVMGPQDGVDLAIRAAAEIVHGFGRDDVSFTFMGAGDSYPELVALRDQLGLREYVELPGRVPDSFVTDVLSTADLGLCPDPLNPLNDVSTMNKTMEYMAFGLPVVAFDLRETRVSAGDAAVYVEPNDVGLFARGVVDLLDQPELRSKMGRAGRTRVVDELAWEHQQHAYVEIFANLARATTDARR